MRRIAPIISSFVLLIAAVCHGQSLGDAARANRAQKANNSGAAKVISNDDFSAPPSIIHLQPGTTSNGEGTLVAPGRGKHSYLVTNLDATRFISGGVLHITITVGSEKSEASFDLYPEGLPMPTEGWPQSLAGAHSIPSGGSAKIDYRFDHGRVFQFGAEGSWNAKAGDTNTYSFVVEVGDAQGQ